MKIQTYQIWTGTKSMKEKNIQENDDTKPVILQTAFKNLSSTFWMKHKDATRELTETISKGKEDNMHVVTVHKNRQSPTYIFNRIILQTPKIQSTLKSYTDL